MALKGRNKKSKNLIDSFRFAIEGIIYGVKNVKNMKIHLIFTFLVLIGSLIFRVSLLEFLILLLFIALVISLELVNTAIEEAVNLAMPNVHPIAKIAKDTAAGAVLVSAFIAFIAGFIVFLPKIIDLF